MCKEQNKKERTYEISVSHHSSKLKVIGDKDFVNRIYLDFKNLINLSSKFSSTINEKDFEFVFNKIIETSLEKNIKDYKQDILITYKFMALKEESINVNKKEFSYFYKLCCKIKNKENNYTSEISKAINRTRIIEENNKEVFLTPKGKEILNTLNQKLNTEEEFYNNIQKLYI